eukprot:scaffold52569_cov66-Cyclotella_meneghiniana.AAC.5
MVSPLYLYTLAEISVDRILSAELAKDRAMVLRHQTSIPIPEHQIGDFIVAVCVEALARVKLTSNPQPKHNPTQPNPTTTHHNASHHPPSRPPQPSTLNISPHSPHNINSHPAFKQSQKQKIPMVTHFLNHWVEMQSAQHGSGSASQ